MNNLIIILRNKKTNDIYKYLGEDKYINLTTSKDGEIKKEIVANLFAINVELTQLITEHSIIEDLIKTLKLKIEK